MSKAMFTDIFGMYLPTELQEIMKDYISQGLESMRLTTISETKWIYIH